MGKVPPFRKSPAILPESHIPESPAMNRHAGQHSDPRTSSIKCMNQLRALVPNGGACVSESDYFQKDWQQAHWGSNYGRLAEIKKKYDPDGLFIVHNGVGSEGWSRDGFTKL